MKIETITSTLTAHKGQNLRATWVSPVKTYSGVSATIVKVVTAIVRGGIDYSNLAVVKNGAPFINKGLSWGEWAHFPIHITHDNADYVRLFPSGGIEFRAKVLYIMDGVPVAKSSLRGLIHDSEFAHKNKPTLFNLKAESILALG